MKERFLVNLTGKKGKKKEQRSMKNSSLLGYHFILIYIYMIYEEKWIEVVFF
jgi:hypothetical protein